MRQEGMDLDLIKVFLEGKCVIYCAVLFGYMS